jgi:hypothetical protein
MRKWCDCAWSDIRVCGIWDAVRWGNGLLTHRQRTLRQSRGSLVRVYGSPIPLVISMSVQTMFASAIHSLDAERKCTAIQSHSLPVLLLTNITSSHRNVFKSSCEHYAHALNYTFAFNCTLPIRWRAITAQISCSLVNQTQNINRVNGSTTIKNQNNRKILQIIHPKCLGSPIGSKQERLWGGLWRWFWPTDEEIIFGVRLHKSSFIWIVQCEHLVAQKFGTFSTRTGPRIQKCPMESSAAAAPAVAHESLRPNFQQYCFSERMVRMLQHEPAIEVLKHRSHQI